MSAVLTGRGVSELAPISLEELTARASLMTRTDRKYLVPIEVAHDLVAQLRAQARVLEIDGQRSFGYRSVYYDTSALDSYHDAATGRRRRFKVRRRDYLDTGAAYLEVKTLTGRGESSKQRLEIDADESPRGPLGGEQLAFVTGHLSAASCPLPASALLPQLISEYDRSTVLVEADGTRLTIDAGLTWRDPTRRSRAPRELSSLVVIETKGHTAPGLADRRLWALGHRPRRISKYATGLAAVRGDLAANRWHRTLQAVRADAA